MTITIIRSYLPGVTTAFLTGPVIMLVNPPPPISSEIKNFL